MTGWWSFSRSDDSPQLQAGGFLNDIAVSSHGNSSVQPHERAVAQKQLMYRLAQQTLARSCFYPGERFSQEPANTIQLSVCERTTALFFSSCEKAVGISPHAGGAAFIPRAEARGLTPRFGERWGVKSRAERSALAQVCQKHNLSTRVLDWWRKAYGQR